MIRFLLTAALLASPAAFATGERITLTGSASALKDTLCISMTCVAGGPREFTVSGRPVKGGLELTVTSSTGQARLTTVAKTNADNQLSSTDLVSATTLVIRSIERGPVAAPAATPVKAAAKKKPMPKAALARR